MENKLLSFEEVYIKYYKIIYMHCYYRVGNDEAEDIAQEVFLSLNIGWKQIKNKEEATLKSWLYTAANNKIYKFLNKQKIRKTDYIEIDEAVESDCNEIDTATNELAYTEYLNIINSELNEKDKLLFEYMVISKISFAEIAEKIDKPIPTVRVRWYRLKDKLKEIINKFL